MIFELGYDILYMMPFSLAVMSFAHGYMGDADHGNLWVIITLAVTICILLIKHLDAKGRALIAGMLLTAALGVWVFLPSGEKMDVLSANVWIFRQILASVVCFVAAEILNRYRVIRLTGSLVGTISLVIMLFLRIYVSRMSVCTVLFYAFLVLADEIQLLSKKEGDTDHKKHLVALSPFILVFFILTSVIPVSNKPYDWNIVKRMAGMVRSTYIALSESVFGKNGWDTDSPVIGFSDRGHVGGNIQKAERTVMEITSRNENDPNVYIIGRRYDRFDAGNWEKTDKDKVDEGLLDTIETLNAAIEYTGDGKLYDIIREVNITVEYKDMHTLCLFTPSKYLPRDKTWSGVKTTGGDIDFAKRKNARRPYNITFYRLNRDSAPFEEMVNDLKPLTEEEFYATKNECKIKSDISYVDYVHYKEGIHEHYLEDVTLSAGLKEYMDELLSGAESDYEKLMRIEAMLSGFTYNDSPGEIPDGIDDGSSFLDYFVLDRKEGYCSYFATAFVLLSRSQGIPSRYVQGYRVPVGRQGKVSVTSDMAHAWAESYIDGVGWIAFEPTPGMKELTYWEVSDVAAAVGVVDRDRAVPKSSEESEPDEDVTLEEEERFTIYWYQIVIPVVSGIMLTLLIFAFDRILRKRRYKKMSEEKKAFYLCKNSMELLRRMRLGRKEYETLSEYHDRLKAGSEAEYLEFINIYEEILYSDREVSEGLRLQLEGYFDDLKAFYRAKRLAVLIPRKKID